MSDEKAREDFEDVAEYGKEAGRARVPGDVLFRIGPVLDEETFKVAREVFNPRAFFDAADRLAEGRTLAASLAEGIRSSIAQFHEGYAFDAHAIVAAATAGLLAKHPQPTLGAVIGDFIRAAQEQARVSAFAQLRAAQADVAARAFYNSTMRKGEGCERKQEQQKAKVQDLGTVG